MVQAFVLAMLAELIFSCSCTLILGLDFVDRLPIVHVCLFMDKSSLSWKLFLVVQGWHDSICGWTLFLAF